MKIKKLLLILGAVLLLFAGCKPAFTPVKPGEGGSEPPSAGGNDNGSKDNNSGSQGGTSGNNSGSQGGNSGNNSGNPAVGTDGKYIPLTEAYNPTIGDGKRKKSLQYIFNTDSVGESEIYIKRSEWNKMLAYYDYFYKNENTVAVERFTYKKDGMQWDLKDCGMRLRGNTSRFRPQGKDHATDETGHKMPNADWSPDYYSYAANCSDDDYRQSHFKIDFEPYDVKQKLAGCMKGVALKRMDAAYAREILCYDLFHEYDVFCATRASHTKVTIYMIEEDETVTPVDFGVYEMFEEVNNQFLKARDEADPSAEHTFLHWANADGDLWKCSGDLTPSNVMSRAGVEDVCIKSGDVEIEPGETKDILTWSVKDNRYGYDLKTNKKDFDAAKGRLVAFAKELEGLRGLSFDDAGISQRKAFYEKWFDMDLFLTTYAVNVAVGMDDDYWGNANNFYLYFDNALGGTGKCFLIPFDYDNTLGQSINGDGVYNNPLDWGWNHNSGSRNDRPLMDRLLEVPEYRELYRQKLLEVTAEDSAWSMEKSGAKVTKWKNMVSAKDTDGKPLTYSKDLDNDKPLNSLYWDDKGGWKKSKHYLNREPNIYNQVRTNFKNWIALDRGIDLEIDFNGGSSPETGIEQTEPVSFKLDLETFSLHSLENFTLTNVLPVPKKEGAIFEGWTKTKNGNDLVQNEIPEKVYARWSNPENIDYLFIYELEPGMEGYKKGYEGIQIAILNPPAYQNKGPKGSWRRNIYVNDVKISEDDNEAAITGTHWYYPFVKAGEKYSIRISYKGSDYGTEVQGTNILNVAGVDAFGDFKYENSKTKLEFTVDGNTFTYDTPQGIYAGGLVKDGYTPGYFEVRFHDSSWKFSSGYDINDWKIDSFSLSALINEKMNYTWEGIYMIDYAFNHDMFPTLNYIVSGPTSANGNYRLEIPVVDRGVRATDTRLKLLKDANGKYPGLNIDFDIPSEATERKVYVNNREVSTLGDSETHWVYPFTEEGKEYEIYVGYKIEGESKQTETIKYTGDDTGIGDFRRGDRFLEYQVADNYLTWSFQPELIVCGQPLSSTNMPGKFEIGFMNNTWDTWYAGKTEGNYVLNNFNVKEYLEKY